MSSIALQLFKVFLDTHRNIVVIYIFTSVADIVITQDRRITEICAPVKESRMTVKLQRI